MRSFKSEFYYVIKYHSLIAQLSDKTHLNVIMSNTPKNLKKYITFECTLYLLLLIKADIMSIFVIKCQIFIILADVKCKHRRYCKTN